MSNFYKVGRAITKTGLFRKFGKDAGRAVESMKDRAFLMTREGRSRAANLDAAHSKKGYLKKTLLSRPGTIRRQDYEQKAGYIMADRRIARGQAVRHQIGGQEPLQGRKPIERSVAHKNQYKLHPGSPEGPESSTTKVIRGWNERAFVRDQQWRAKRHYEEMTGERGITMTPIKKNEGMGHMVRRGLRLSDVKQKKAAIARLGKQAAIAEGVVTSSALGLSAYHLAKKKNR